MAAKSSNLNLFASDDLETLAFHVECSDALAKVSAVNTFQVDSQKISFTGNADSSKDIDDVAQYMVDREADRLAKFTLQDGKNDTNAANIAAETTARQNTYDSHAALISAEVTRASGVEAGLQTQLTTETANRISTYNDLDAAITQETSDRAAAVTAATTAATAAIDVAKADAASGDAALNARLDAILEGSGVDYDTLKEIVEAYQLQDTQISSTITTLRSDFEELKARYDTAFPDGQP